MWRIRPLLVLLLAAAPAWAQGAFLGVQVSPAEEGGVQVVLVNPDTAAEIMGLQAGDRLVELDGEEIASVESFVREIGRRQPGSIIQLDLIRDGKPVAVRGVLGRRPGLVPAVPRELDLTPGDRDDAERWLFELPDIRLPGLPGFGPDEDWFHRFEDFEREQLRRLQQRLDAMREHGLAPFQDGFRIEFGGPEGFRMEGLDRIERKVKVRYPGDTPEEKREELIRQAKEKYGEDAEVVFEGEGTSVMITTRAAGGVDPAEGDLLHELMEEDGDTAAAPDPEAVEEPAEKPAHREPTAKPEETPAEGWHATLEEALAAAKESGKPILLDFSAEWCGPCRALAAEVLTSERYADLIDRFEPVRVDVDRQRQLAADYGVGGIPDLRILTPDGRQVHKIVGYGDAEAAAAELRAALEKAAAGGGEEVDADRAGLEEQRDRLRKELEEARRQLEELRKELGSDG
ncbi:MAG: PDZ domain-containing protein [Planctomycetota bacterium]|nr:MAG: PDZ domain-containing protein [Planctomycetota bacterium]